MLFHFNYLSVVTATILISLSGIAPVTRQVSPQITDHKRSDIILASQIKVKSQIRQLNDESIKLSQQRRFPEALQRLQQALTMSQEIGDRAFEAATFNNIGRVQFLQLPHSNTVNRPFRQNPTQYQDVLKSYQQALVLNKAIGDRISLGRTYSNIGYLFEMLNEPELAILFYKQCVNNREQVRLNPPKVLPQQPEAFNLTVSGVYRTLGVQLIKQQRIGEAQRIMDLVKVQELEEYIHGVRGNKRTVKGVELQPQEVKIRDEIVKNVDNSVAIGKELSTLRQIAPDKRTPQQKQRIAQLVTTQQQLSEQFNKFITSPTVKQQVEQINRTAKRQNLDLESLNEVRDNLRRLPQKSVLLYPLVLQDSLELIIVTPESPPIHRTVAVKRDTLNQTIQKFRQALENPSLDVKTPARQLHTWLIKPVEGDLQQANAQTIVYAPDDQLRYVPLAALYDNKWLVERYSINHITAASLTNFNTPRQSQLRVLAGAFTKGSYKVRVGTREVAFSGLPFAAKEVEELAAVVPRTKTLLDGAFNPQATLPQLDDYTIVHLATHAAFVVGKPEDSFILFGNGDRATLRDVGNWSLPSVDLVVLSACETGLGGKLGNGEEILGFGYQIQRTGARSAIASLWAVDDGGTQALMSAFYTTLPSGITKTQALRQAQIALISGNSPRSKQQSQSLTNLSHPYYWAPFILIGNGL
jgi:CHAT domain-containing protein